MNSQKPIKPIDLIKDSIFKSRKTADVELSTGQLVKVRAFALKELKLLVAAIQDPKATETAFMTILKACCITSVDFDLLASHDVELLYLNLYKISKGTSFETPFTCTAEHEGEPCNHVIDVLINLDAIKQDKAELKPIELDQLTLNMRFPSMTEREELQKDVATDIFNLAMNCVVSVDTGSELLVVGEDLTSEDLTEVIEMMDTEAYNKIIDHILNLPQLKLYIPVKCDKCGHSEVLELTGLDEIF